MLTTKVTVRDDAHRHQRRPLSLRDDQRADATVVHLIRHINNGSGGVHGGDVSRYQVLDSHTD